MKLLVILSALLSQIAAFAGEIEMTLADALAQNRVQVTATGKGGYKGDVVTLAVQSLDNRQLKLKLPMGLTLKSDDPGEQDLVVTRNYVVYLDKKAAKQISLQTLCMQQSNSSPAEGSTFTVGELADANMLKLLRFVKGSPIGLNAFQEALWVLTDGNGIENVYDPDMMATKNLQEFLATITGQQLPWYSVEHEDSDPGETAERIAVKVHGVFEFELETGTHVTLAVYNADGEQVYVIANDQPFQAGRVGMRFSFDANNVPEGEYFVRVTANGNVLKEQSFSI